MADQIVITEKTSQAKDVRAAVGARYGDILPAEGHLLDLEEPEDAVPEWKRWSPILLRPDGLYATKPADGGNKAAKLRAIREALRTAKVVWLATDCDREGQLIGQEILEHYRYGGEVRRVLFTAQDPQTIREAFVCAKPNSDYSHLYAAAVARRQADQIYNLSLTRSATVILGQGARGVIGVGRVKTPTLAIVCKRELEIRDFVPVSYFEVVATAKVEAGEFKMRYAPQERIFKREEADFIAKAAEGFRGALSIRVDDKKQGPPKLHDLPSLQKLCSTRFGWSAAKTLEVAQELYDGQGKKIITYPRAEVRYLPENLIPDAPRIIAGLQVGQSFKEIPVPTPPVIRRGAHGAFHDKGLEGASHHAVIPNVNMIDRLREVWPRLSLDEKKLFDVIARAYLASVMPDFRYRQTTATLDVAGFVFKASGRQPIDLGWRAAFPEWTPADEKGDDAQLLPGMRHGESADLQNPMVEAKETRPPPRYNEGGLIEAMQNAWRFVEEEALRDRLKEAKGIGTPATRAEIIAGLKRQGFLVAQGKNIVPTEVGLKLFAILQEADPALVDPGVTAQLECLLDDVVVGKQAMMSAVDAVCDVAERIIGKLRNAPHGKGSGLLGPSSGGAGGVRPPTPAMKRYAVSISRQKRVSLPKNYATSAPICRAFLEQHAPRKSADSAVGAQAPSESSSEGMEHGPRARTAKARAKAGGKSLKPGVESSANLTRRKRKLTAAEAPILTAPSNDEPGSTTANTPLRIPYGNKEVAKRLGARYAATGWYAPPGVDLAAFTAQGWL